MNEYASDQVNKARAVCFYISAEVVILSFIFIYFG